MVYNASTSEDIILSYAVKYGINGADFLNTLTCESDLKPDAVGDQGTSFGVAQIHLPAHKDVTKIEALNPLFAINWAASEFANGRANEWTCYRKLKK